MYRQFSVWQLLQVKQPLDIFLSHDWPRGITNHGDSQQLLRSKSFLREEIENDSFGSPPAWSILTQLQPRFWFSAHMHVKFPAVVRHTQSVGNQSGQTSLSSSGVGSSGGATASVTRFLALDKALPRRDFLHVVHFPGLCMEICF